MLAEPYDSHYDRLNDFFKPLHMDQDIDEEIFDPVNPFLSDKLASSLCTPDGLFAVREILWFGSFCWENVER